MLSPKFISGWDIKIKTIDIGCRKGIKVSDLQECIKIWEELNKE